MRESTGVFLREIPRAAEEVKAPGSESFGDLSRAVSALDEERLRIVVLFAAMSLVRNRLSPEQWREWLLAGRQ